MEYNKQFIKHCLIPSDSFKNKFLSVKIGKFSRNTLINVELCFNKYDIVEIALNLSSGLLLLKNTFIILSI